MKTRTCILYLSAALLALASCEKNDPSLVVHYLFDNSDNNIVADATGNGHNATLEQGATVKKVGRWGVMDLGADNGFLDMGASMGDLIVTLEDYSITTYLRVDTAARVRAYGNFVYAFSTMEHCTGTEGRFVAYRVNQQRHEQSIGGGMPERELVGIMADRPAEKGVWMHVAYSQGGRTGTLYLNGEVLATGPAVLQPKDIGEAPRFNWLGKPHFANDVYLKAMYHDFRIYNRALSQEEIKNLAQNLDGLRAEEQ
ncbi:MAG: LamG domain-containing protein [Bacteroidales bacterium]|jgi:hypothetical protein|nr:LamG domain-containing protein [Bacteroidales bacterium]